MNHVSTQIIILAAGKGTRMGSNLPKPMHLVGKKTMLRHVVDNALNVTKDLVLVYSDSLESYLHLFPECKTIKQDKTLGTAHAVYCAMEKIDNQKHVCVLYADNPLIDSSIIKALISKLEAADSKIVSLAFRCKDSNNAYGRVILDKNGYLQKIIEFKHANSKERLVDLCNSGVMAFAPNILEQYLPECLKVVKYENQEFYLTDIIEHCTKDRQRVSCHILKDSNLAVGVNTQHDLSKVNQIVQSSRN